VGLSAVGVGSVGHWLVVADPLEHAEAIVVLSGRLPFRAMEAAGLYKEGWAREVWITRVSRPARKLALGRLGIRFIGEEIYNGQVLERLGVPVDSIRLLNKGIRNTVDEVRLIAEEVVRLGGRNVILVTSKAHTRRVRATWQALIGKSPRGIVRYAKKDPYLPDRWWWNTRDALVVSREVFGLMNVWVGFPVRPDRQG